jgi:hypothetical protein
LSIGSFKCNALSPLAILRRQRGVFNIPSIYFSN